MNSDSSNQLLNISEEVAHLISRITENEMMFFISDNIEILHNLRVDLRKLRTWLKIFKAADYPVKKLQKHSLRCHALGENLRNFDVLIHWVQKNQSLISPHFSHALNSRREQLKTDFIKELTNTNAISKLRIICRNFLPHIKGVTKSEFLPHVERFINKKRLAVSKILPITAIDLAQMHEMRKILKKVRYSFLLMTSANLSTTATLKELQDILGYINDRHVWIEIIETEFNTVKEGKIVANIFRNEIEEKLIELQCYISLKREFF